MPLALLAAPAQAQAQLTVARTSTPIFYTDVGNTPSLQCAYASYRITNTSGVTQPDVWIGIGSFTGGVVRLAPGEDGLIHFGSMAPGEVRNAYFYLQAPSITAVAQAHTVSIYTSKPPVAAAVTQVFSFSQVVSTIAASANKVTTVVTGPKPPGLGGVVTITVSGETGTIGAAGILALSPATDTAWRPDALEMLGCTVTLSGSPNAGVHTDSLYYVLPSASATDYVIEYRFRAVGTTAAPVAVTPIGYISSGTQIKHTSTGNFLNGTLEPIEPPSNFVTVTKQVTPASLIEHGDATWTLRFANAASFPLSLDNIVDDLPTGAIYRPGTSTFGGTPIADPVVTGSHLEWGSFFNVAGSGTTDLVFKTYLPPIYGTRSNSAYAHAGNVIIDSTLATTDSLPAHASLVVVRSVANLSAVKTASPNPVAIGTPLVYRIVVSNAGPDSAVAATVVDTLAASVTYVSASTTAGTVGQSGGIVTASLGRMGPGRADTVSVIVTPNVLGTLSNTAHVTTTSIEPDSTNNGSSTSVAVALFEPDLSVVKSSNGPFTEGTNGTYTIKVRNGGTATTAGGMTVVDSLPTGLSYVSSVGGTWTVGVSGQVVTATNPGPIAAGDSSSFTVTVAVAPAAVPSVTNAATVSGGGDATPGNNRGSDTTVVNGVPDLSVVKTSNGPFTDGTNGIYTIKVYNTGSGATTGGMTVVDSLPTGLSYVSSVGGTWTVGSAGQIVTATNPGPIAAGDSSSVTITVAVAAAAVPSVTNAATVSGGGDTTPGNNRGSNTTVVNGVSDLSVVKTSSGPFTDGTNGIYTIKVFNVGSAATSGGITVVDSLPTGLTYVSSAPGSWSLGTAGQVVTATNAGPIAAGDSSSFTITVAVASSAVPSVTNAATVSGGGDTTPGNNRGSNTTVVNGVPDLAVVKTSDGPFNVGVNGNYTLVVRNVGSGATSGTITLVDSLPTGITYVSDSGGAWSVAIAGQVVTATSAGSLAAGDSSSLTITVGVGVAALPSVTNAATASGGGDTTPGNNRNSNTTSVSTVPEISVVKTSDGPFTMGTNGIYMITLRNLGNVPTTGGITVVDSLPTGLTYVSSVGGSWTVGNSGQVVTATNAGPIAVGDSSSFTITVGVGAAAVPSVTNAATASGGGDTTPSNNRGSDTTVVNGLPDLLLVKTSNGPFTVGTNGVYTIKVFNTGNGATISGITVVDSLPTGLTYVSSVGGTWTVGVSGQVVTATNPGPIAAGDSSSFTVTVAVAPAAVPSATNAATVSGGGDATPGNNRGSNTTVVNGVPDLSVVKTSNGPFTDGTNGIYTIKVYNTGSGATIGGITMVDSLPTGLSYVSSVGGTWTVGSAGQIVTATNPGPIAAGDSSSFTITVAVAAAAVPSVTNAATVSGGGDTTPGNNRASDTTAVNGVPNLFTVKTSNGPFTDGTNGIYTIKVFNVGSAATSGGITVVDSLPTGLAYVSSAPGSWSLGTAGQVVTATNAGPIAAGDSSSFTITVAVAASAVPSVTNAATVSGGGDTTPGNNRGSDTTAVNGVPDLLVVKTSNGPFNVGVNGVYTIKVFNIGSGATTGGITVVDSLPTGITYVSDSGGAWSVAIAGPVVTATSAASIAAGDSSSFTITVGVGVAALPSVTNAATVSGGGDTTPGNNRDTNTTSVSSVPDLSIVKTSNGPFTVGTNGTYTITVHNLGSVPTTGGITVVDSLPTGLTYFSSAPGAWSVGTAGQIVTATNAGPIAAGDSSSFTITVMVAASAVPSVTNAATVSGGGDTAPGNNRGTDVTAVAGLADLSVSKSSNGPFAVGANGIYTLVVRNIGTAATSGTITLVDSLPAGLTFVSSSGAWTVGAAGQVVTATNGAAIAAGDSSTLTITVGVGAAAVPSVTNAATASGGGDSTPGNNRGSDTSGVNGAPDLTVVKTSSGSFTIGANATYTFVVRNVGSAATSGTTTVVDSLPPGLTFAGSSGGAWNVGNAGQVVTATNSGSIAPGDSSSFTLTVAIGSAAAPSVTNSATVSGGGDSSPGNDRGSDTASVSSLADLSVVKTSNGPFAIGASGTYTLVVHNTGAGTSSGTITLVDSLPPGLTYVSSAGGGWSVSSAGQIVIATNAGPIAAGDSSSFTLTVAVGPAAAPGVTNTATVSGGGDTNSGNNRGSAFAPVAASTLALDVEKGASPTRVPLGGSVDYSVRVTNPSASTVDSVSILDQLPAGFRYQSRTARLDGVAIANPIGAPGPSLSFYIGALASGQTRLLTYRVNVGAGAGLSNGTNTAVAVAPGPGGGVLASTVASARVTVLDGIFGDAGIIAGKIFANRDCVGGESQGAEEIGIPGVRVLLEDGTAAITDVEGKYSFTNVAPRTHVLHVDRSTLPEGSRLDGSTTRDAGQPGSRFVDLQVGEFHRADFREISGDSLVFARILERRSRGEVSQAAASPAPPGAMESGADSTKIPAHPLILTALMNARLDLRSRKDADLAGTRRDGFQEALNDVRDVSDEGRTITSARGALYMAGDIGHRTLLTARYDTEGDRSHRLFRDIRPFEGYDVLGDASVHEWNAQSDSRLYVRVDRDSSFAQFGDFRTPVRADQKLGAFQRSLTGGLAQAGIPRAKAAGFVTQGSSRQVVDELAGLGVSGPYTLSRTDGIEGSDQIEIITRDRNQPSRILSRRRLTRFTDYTIEPFTGRVVFRQPVPSADDLLNPVSVRVTYEAEGAGDAFWKYGGNVTLSPGSAFVLGASAVRDEDPARPANLASIDAVLAPASGVRLVGEFARSDSGATFLGSNVHGQAWRGEATVNRSRLSASLFASRVEVGFDNASSGLSPGREELGGQLRFDPSTRSALFVSGLRSEDLVTGGRRDGVEVGASSRFGAVFGLETAYRWAEETTAPATRSTAGATPNETNSIRGRLSAQIPSRMKLGLFAELEQDLEASDQRRWALGADAQVLARTRLYARHENNSSFAGPFAMNGSQQVSQTVIGVASDNLRDGHLFTEYRARDAFAGRDAQAAYGLRNRWTLSPGLHLDGSFERTTPLAGADSSGLLTGATSVTGGIEWTRDPLWKGTARVEFRDAASHDQWLTTLGASRKLSRDWAALGRAVWMHAPDEDREDRRTQLGVAFRQTDTNAWNALARWENRFENSGPAGGDTKHLANIVATHVNVKPAPGWTLSGQAAAKWSTDESGGLSSRTTTQLLGGRAIVDLTHRFDVGVTGRVLHGGGGPQSRFGLGGELGAMLIHGVRGSVGYNVFGFKDPDLGMDASDRGLYVQLGAKFDETSFGGSRK